MEDGVDGVVGGLRATFEDQAGFTRDFSQRLFCSVRQIM